MHSSTSGSLQHIASAVRWCSHFIQINATTTVGFFFLLWSPCVLVLYICVYVCVYMHTFKAVAGTVGWKHKCKMRSVNENWNLAKMNTLLDGDGDGKWICRVRNSLFRKGCRKSNIMQRSSV